MMKFIFSFFMLALFLLFSYGCEIPQGEESKQSADPQRLEKRFRLGGAPLEVIVGLSSETIELTDFLTVTVRVEHSEAVQLEPPYLSEAVYAPLLLIRNPQEDLFWAEKQNRIIKTWVYRFEPVKSGEFKLRPFQVFFRLASERKPQMEKWPVYKIETSEIRYRVTSVEIDDQSDIRDVKGPIQPEYDYLPLFVATAGIGFLLFSFWLGFRIRSHFQNETLPAVEAVDYLRESLRRLKKLEEKDYISQQQYDRLHVELSAVLRYFVENHFGLKAREQTTEEFIQEIQYSLHFSTEQQAILQQFLELADLVKFATYDPGSEVSREAMKTVRYFIESTGKPNED
ncbi:MAG: hypothetical protein HN580_03420 [Deltaproteobacteria bacterium]|nr:hypothetical protein [Deltaproteobacteria bacterium]